MTTPPPTADEGWLPDEATLNRWAGEFWSALPDDSGPPSGLGVPGGSAPGSVPLPGDPSDGAGQAPEGVPSPPTSAATHDPRQTPVSVVPDAPAPGGVTPGDPTPLDPILALALAPFLAVPGGGAPLDSVPAPVDAPGSAVPSWLASPVSTIPSFGFLDGLETSSAEGGPTGDVPTAARVRPSPIGFDLNKVRADFPILSERVNGHQLVWFDNAATTQKPRAVIDRLTHFYEHENSNIHRAAHELAARSTDAYEQARSTVARFLGAGSADQIIFVRGATEAINLVAKTWGKANIGEGDEIVISHLEHHANIVPWQQLIAETGGVLKVIPVDDSGQIILSEFHRLLGPRTKLVSVTHVSNALGTVTPVKDIIEASHRVGARVLIDGAQSVPHLRVDLQSLQPDFYLFSGHKIYGPSGIGALYGAADVLESMPPWQGGGNMITHVTLEHSEFHEPPGRFEAGTGNIADAVGLGAAIDYVERIGIEAIAAYEHALLEYATPLVAAVPGVHLVGTADEKASVLSFVMDGYEPEQIGTALNEEGIAVRAGHHCAQPILERFGLTATVRPSFAFYNTCEEIDRMVSVLHRLAADGGRGHHGWNGSAPPALP